MHNARKHIVTHSSVRIKKSLNESIDMYQTSLRGWTYERVSRPRDGVAQDEAIKLGTMFDWTVRNRLQEWSVCAKFNLCYYCRFCLDGAGKTC